MADTKIIRNSFTRALDENQTIEDRFRNLMHDTLDGLYSAMGKKNFLRWVNTRDLSDRIKKLIVEEFSKEDLEKYPNWAGYYTHGTNRQKLKQESIDENTARHETLHFFTDYVFTGKTFPPFINEGLTEYLNREFEKIETGNNDVKYTYKQNVDFVEFLHNVMGDLLIKTYLTGTSKAFEKEFSTYITEDGKTNIEALGRFYDSLNRVHKLLHPNTNPKTPEEQEKIETNKREVIENDYPLLRKAVVNIVSNTIRKKARDLEYYKNGEFFIEDAVNDINELTEKTFKLLGKYRTFEISRSLTELHESILKTALTAVLQESHISNDAVENIVNKSLVKRL